MTAKAPDPLLEGLRKGDPGAFDAVYEREKAGVYAFLVRLTGDAHAAADLFQNVWLKLARHAAELRSDSNVRAWLFTVARREFISHRRAQALDLSRVFLLGLIPAAAAEEPNGQLASLKAACARLSDADRELLLLTGVDGLDAEAAATVLGISSAALRQRLSRARRRLAQLMAEDRLPDSARWARKGTP
jgi:RNA polymerase sigma factor (sigma-70 family)